MGVRRDPCVSQCEGPGQYRVASEDGALGVRRAADAWWIDDMRTGAEVICRGEAVSVFWGNGYHFDLPDPLDRGSVGHAVDVIEAPMPGLVKAVHVEAGATVAAGRRGWRCWRR